MDTSRPLLRTFKKHISLDEALDDDHDVLSELDARQSFEDFQYRMYLRREEVEVVVARHLGIPRSDCTVKLQNWLPGSFNLIIPILVADRSQRSDLRRQVICRVPMPQRVGERFRPGNVEEKLRTEAATYVWMQQNCSDIRIPRLYGFGFPNGPSFTSVQMESLWNRLRWHWRRALAWMLGRPISRYFAHQRTLLNDIGYMVLEYVDSGRMLSDSWRPDLVPEHNDTRRQNLFRGLSRIMLRLAQVPQPRIGSWTMDNNGSISLSNRPLLSLFHSLEKRETPVPIPRDLTYTATEPYFLDMFECHDARLRKQLNAIHDQEDGEGQLGAIAAMRAVFPKLINRQHRQGPFIPVLTDMHRSNFFVDEDWNITCIIDLEWLCTRPIDILLVPHWLTDRAPDSINDKHLEDFEKVFFEFTACFEQEELALSGSVKFAHLLRDSWRNGSYWYMLAIDRPDCVYSIFWDHICPRFTEDTDELRKCLAYFWSGDAMKFIASKAKDQEQYDALLKEAYVKALDKADKVAQDS